MATNRTTAERIEAKKTEMAQKRNELNLLLQKHRREERKARTHRICVRGGMLEGLLPDTIMLSDERFKTFLEKAAANKFGRDILTALKAEQEKENGENGSGTTAEDCETSAAKPEPVSNYNDETGAMETAASPRNVSEIISAETSTPARQAG